MAGLPSDTTFTPVPDPFLGEFLLGIRDQAELVILLRLLWLWHHKRSYPRYVTLAELKADPVVTQVGEDGEIAHALERAVREGLLLCVPVRGPDGGEGQAYLLNTAAGRHTAERIRTEELPPLPTTPSAEGAAQPPRSTIFTLYEENIGILTPLIAEELKAAELEFPHQWIEEALREAAASNHRSWRYIRRILERWALEGKDHGKPGRHSQKVDAQSYLRGWGPPRGPHIQRG